MYRERKSQTRKYGFNYSEKLALRYGFEVIYKEDAFNGRFFERDGKKWIHNIDALKSRISRDEGVSDISDYDLKDFGYDVDAYYDSH